MNESTQNITISADPKSCAMIKEFLHTYPSHRLHLCSQEHNHDITIHSAAFKKTLKTPLRIGEVLDEIERHIHAQNTAQTRFLKLKDATLDTHLGIFTRNNQADITLTEKEIEILIILYRQKNQTISRDDLLHAVWNYAEGVETHTLETHIYRLRQKIEKSPSKPEILITQNGGYIIGT